MAPTQPKRPVGGAYGIFLAENRERFTKACAGQKASAISQMAGAEWKKLTDAAKAPYGKKFEVVKATYEKDLQAFKDAGGVLEKGILAQRSEKRKEKEGRRKKKDPNAPKRPAGGAYGQYLNANRELIKKQLPADHKMVDVAKKAGELWAKISPAEKKPYEEKYQKLNEEYKKAIEEWKKTHAGEDAAEDDEDEEEEEEEEPVSKKSRKAGA